MREIERKVLYAVRGCKNFKRANTEVKSYATPMTEQGEYTRVSEVYLHGNLIYMFIEDKGQVYEVFSLCGWNTTTTRSRLRALLQNGFIYQKNWSLYCQVMQGGMWVVNEINEDNYYCISNRYLHELNREYDLRVKIQSIVEKVCKK